MGEAVKIIDEYQMILMSIFLGLLEMGKHSIDLLESRRMNLCSWNCWAAMIGLNKLVKNFPKKNLLIGRVDIGFTEQVV